MTISVVYTAAKSRLEATKEAQSKSVGTIPAMRHFCLCPKNAAKIAPTRGQKAQYIPFE